MTYYEAMHNAERDYWLALMTEYRWNYLQVAKAAGVNRKSMYRMLERAGVSRPAGQPYNGMRKGPRIRSAGLVPLHR